MNAHKRFLRLGLLISFVTSMLIVACGQSMEETYRGDDSEIEIVDEPQFLTGDDLRVWPAVDTSGQNGDVLKILRTFFNDKMKKLGAEQQAYWIPEDYEQFVRDYSEIRYAEYGPDAKVKYWPTLLAIDAVRGSIDQRLATVRWASVDELGAPEKVMYVFRFLLKPDDNGSLKLTAPLESFTKDWRREVLSGVTFVLSPKHKFSRKQAEEQKKSIDWMSSFFEVESFPITFYSFQNTTELLQTRGYLQHPLMYKFESGGQAGVGDVVYSGNDRDEYIHEVVHLFISKKIPKSTGILNEGLATLIGGSSGYPYKWHVGKFEKWLKVNPDVELTEYLNPYQSKYIEEDTSIPYTIGALLCDKILQEQGKEVLFKALEEGADPWAFLESYGVVKSELRETLLEQIGSVKDLSKGAW